MFGKDYKTIFIFSTYTLNSFIQLICNIDIISYYDFKHILFSFI